MARKLEAQEPLLIAAARKLGQAAGTLVNMTQMLTTEQKTPESRSSSKPGSIEPAPANTRKSRATVRRNRPKKQGHASPKKRTVKSRKPSARNPMATKRGRNRKS